MSSRYKHDSLTFAPEDPELLPIPVRESSPLPVQIVGSLPVTIATEIEITNDEGNAIPVQGTVNVGALPASAATSAAQATGNAALESLVTQTNNVETLLSAIDADTALVASAVSTHDAVAVDGRAGLVILVRRRDADAEPAVAEGDFTFLNIDEEGRLKVASKPSSYPDITGNITAVQATVGTPVVGGTVEGDVSRASNIMAFCTGLFTGINCTFEGSLELTGDTNWFTVQAARSNANTPETATGNLSAQPAYAWELSVNALKRLRVRCTARTGGTQSWRFVQGTYATEPIPVAQVTATQPVSGTVANGAGVARIGFIAGAGIWFDDSSTNLGASATFTGASRDLTVAATAVAFANAATYAKELRVAAESDVAGTLWIDYSRDNVNWRRARSIATAAVTGGGQFADLIVRPAWRYVRVGYTNGAGAQARFTINSMLVAV